MQVDSAWIDTPVPLQGEWAVERAELLEELRASGEKHLILVRYAADHEWHWEWVYNDADIDRSPVVWARDLGPHANADLLDYFHDRKIWLLLADSEDRRLIPFPRPHR